VDALAAWSPCGGHECSGAANPHALADKVSRKQWREHREGGGNAPDKVAAVRAHPSSGSTCKGGVEATR
jgi:hypothetical protein